jgi:hypothetical protein
MTNVTDIHTKAPRPTFYDQEAAASARRTARKQLAVGGTVLALMGAGGLIAADKHTQDSLKSGSPKIYTEQEMAALPDPRTITVKEGDTPGTLGERVDPKVYSGSVSSTAETDQLNQYILDQDPGKRFLHPGEAVSVPVIPGMQKLPEKPQNPRQP